MTAKADSADDVAGVYERQAARFDRDRSRTLFEADWLERFAADLPDGARVLDLGCGAGEPIARWLIERGFEVTGIDVAFAMIDLARHRWPEGDWHQGDMRTLDLPDRFDGIIGWNSFFHLTADEQRECLPRLARHLEPGGSLMLTVGPKAGERWGTVGKEAIYHASLSPAAYATLLEENGLRLAAFVAEDNACAGHSILLARKDGESAA